MTTLGCIRGKLGSTEYYSVIMPAGTLIDSVGLAMEMPEWENMTADEKMQRTPDINRIVNEIVPYIVNDPDRFFGSLIVDIYSGFEDIHFESIANITSNILGAYAGSTKNMGYITLPGSQRLIALDGQHRLIALKVAIKGFSAIPWGSKAQPIWEKTLKPHPELSSQDISVIFVKHEDNVKIRKIFNKVNKYAKQTSRSDNIITSDDNINAIISRKLFQKEGILAPIGNTELVNWKSNTLSKRSKNLTTISALYTISEILLKDKNYVNGEIPSKEMVKEAYQEVCKFWEEVLSGLNIFKLYLKLTKEDKPVSKLREENLLMKPVTQMALAHVAYTAKKKNVSWSECVLKLNQIDWSLNNNVWFNILIIGSTTKKMITGKEAIRSAGMIISYMVMGDKMTNQEIQAVVNIICNAKDNPDEPLPEIIY